MFKRFEECFYFFIFQREGFGRGRPPAGEHFGHGGPGGPGGYGQPDMGYQGGSGNGTPGLQGAVMMVYGLEADKMNCDRLFNLFCLYGNVVRVSHIC